MGRSQDSFSKREKEKKRLKKKKEKEERRAQRKAEKEATGKKSFEDMISYVDADGNLVDTPPDPADKKVEVKLEDIQLGAAPREEIELDPIRPGRVKFFNEEKGFGFIIDEETEESVFVHINNLERPLYDGEKVTFEIEMGPKGPVAVNVTLLEP